MTNEMIAIGHELEALALKFHKLYLEHKGCNQLVSYLQNNETGNTVFISTDNFSSTLIKGSLDLKSDVFEEAKSEG